MKKLTSESRKISTIYGIKKESFPGAVMIKNPHASAGDMGWIPGLGRFPGEDNGNPLQCSCLENPMNSEAWWATVQGVSESWAQLSTWHTGNGKIISFNNMCGGSCGK